ncbi:MAG: hypothetical protein SGPRY_011616, partial [Prymnesium sp.]
QTVPPSARASDGAREYARVAARASIAAIIRQSIDDIDGTASFEFCEASALDSLVDVLIELLRTLGGVSSAAAAHAGRGEVNLGDVLHALKLSRITSPSSLLSFLSTVPEETLPHNIAPFPVERKREAPPRVASWKQAGGRPPFIPDFLPPFPDPSTYLRTETSNSRVGDISYAKKKRSRHKREAQDSLHALNQRMEGEATQLQGAPPALVDGVRAGGGGAGGGGGKEGRLVEQSISEASSAPREMGPPDALLAVHAAALQSSAAHECSGLRTEAARPADPGVALLAPAARPAPKEDTTLATNGNPGKRSKAETILSLQHLHDLEEVCLLLLGVMEMRGREDGTFLHHACKWHYDFRTRMQRSRPLPGIDGRQGNDQANIA